MDDYIFKNVIYPFSVAKNNDKEILKEEKIINEIVNVSSIEEKPIVYIYNTHDTEKYKLNYITDYSITPDVRIASYILKDHLSDLNISSYVETNRPSDYVKKNKLSYYYMYDGSRKYMIEAKDKYNFDIYIDIHRDSSKYNKTLYEEDGIKYAKVLFVLAKKNPNYKENEKFVKYLNESLNSKHKGITRGILNRNDVIFNQDLGKNAILLELGGVDNSIEEINNTLKVFSEVLKEYIDKEGINGRK